MNHFHSLFPTISNPDRKIVHFYSLKRLQVVNFEIFICKFIWFDHYFKRLVVNLSRNFRSFQRIRNRTLKTFFCRFPSSTKITLYYLEKNYNPVKCQRILARYKVTRWETYVFSLMFHKVRNKNLYFTTYARKKKTVPLLFYSRFLSCCFFSSTSSLFIYSNKGQHAYLAFKNWTYSLLEWNSSTLSHITYTTPNTGAFSKRKNGS